MKTFRDFIAECEIIEGKVEWDNPKRPLQSGLTPREKNRAVRKRLGVEDPDKSSFFKGGPSERDYERYGKLKITHETEKNKKDPKEKLHKFKTNTSVLGKITTGRIRRLTGRYIRPDVRYGSKLKDLKEPKD
jgi:hypothetical protein